MLIGFKVANFRSIREEQSLSLVASKAGKELPFCLIDGNLPGLKAVKFLKGAAIYGANASGKSNIIAAIFFLSRFVVESATKLQANDDQTGAEPFKLDFKSFKKSSKFEIEFVANGIRYLFGLWVKPQRVVKEYLVAYAKGIPQHWYKREFDTAKNNYIWAKSSSSFKHDRSLQEKTKHNTLFLSVAAQFNHPQLTPVYNWFKKNLHFISLGADANVNPLFTANLIIKKYMINVS
jgi:AAA15 family ATPase/GTPase